VQNVTINDHTSLYMNAIRTLIMIRTENLTVHENQTVLRSQ